MPGKQSFNQTRQRAKELRQQMTSAEQVLWIQLRGRRLGGYKFRRLSATLSPSFPSGHGSTQDSGQA
jgi:very-short-patch-repair endonuclease